jgi:uncharacterized protein (DUF924 family)
MLSVGARAAVMLSIMDDARAVLDFWFGRDVLSAGKLAERMKFWFGGEAPAEAERQRDAEISRRFGDLFQRAERGELASWADSPRRRLALVLLLDQFSRNIHRGSARAFATDEQALALALSGMQVGADAALNAVERIFFYMPLQHSESREVQEESVAAYRRLLAESPQELRPVFADVLKYAELHRDIVERFGRFPHRNRVLGRETTPQELAYLRTAETFGQ